MTQLTWDQPTDKVYQVGVDRGVLYADGRPAVAWNGLVSVKESPVNGDVSFYYLDGQRYLVLVGDSEYQATLEAFTYPDEFMACDGSQSIRMGLQAHDQPRTRFGLSYRTKVGDEINGVDLGYKIHLVYNALATPSEKDYGTISNVTTPTNFSWTLNAVPVAMTGFRPTAHYTIDTRYLDPFLVEQLEDILYGDEINPPRLPTPEELDVIFETYQVLTITDNGDGTWTADGPDAWITMLTADTFQIDAPSAAYIDVDTYTISSM